MSRTSRYIFLKNRVSTCRPRTQTSYKIFFLISFSVLSICGSASYLIHESGDCSMNENTFLQFIQFMGSCKCMFFFLSLRNRAVDRVRVRMGEFSTAGLIFVLHRKVLPRSLKLLPPPAFSPKWRSYLGQTIPSPWTLIQCTLFCRGGRNGPTSASSTPLSQNATVCGGLYDLLCLWGPSPTPLCWMSAPWLS